MKNPMLDNEFLYNLSQEKDRQIQVRITALSFDERPLETIEGRVQNGSVNLEGNSAVRATCNLSLIAKEVNCTDFYWGVSNKFLLEVGQLNQINAAYPDVIWFKMGIFVITSFSTSFSTNNFTISISGKDKMCLLNGDVSGKLASSVDFGKIENVSEYYQEVVFQNKTMYKAHTYYLYENGEYILSDLEYDETKHYFTKEIMVEQEKYTLKDIIREAVHTYGKEGYHNIVINDLDDYGLELIEYRGDVPLYLFYNENLGIYENMTPKGEMEVVNKASRQSIRLSDIPPQNYNNAVDDFNDERMIVIPKGIPEDQIEQASYSITKIDTGAVIGYRSTDLVYAGELISNIGDTLTSMLDKIKNMLGGFEYFYDSEGRFVFQKTKIYTITNWNSIEESDNNPFARDASEVSKYSYSFEDVNLVNSFQNTPPISKIRNDFSVWGKRKSVSGAEIPIHARYAIAEKPKYYKNYKNEIFVTKEYSLELDQMQELKIVDWREIIYQMSLDYYKHNQDNDFLYKVQHNNIKPNSFESFYPKGITGYEAFYIDLQGFWRQLYNPDPEITYETEGGQYTIKRIPSETDSTYFTTETVWEDYIVTPKILACDFYLNPTTRNDEIAENDEYYSEKNYYWNRNVVLAPELLNFWFDFYEVGDMLSQFSIQSIGMRSEVVNNDKVTSVYFRNIPQVLLVTEDELTDLIDFKTGYTYIRIPSSMEDCFSISSMGISANEKINEMFSEKAQCSESVTIKTIPVYNIKPNTLIYLSNNENNINGEYEVSRVSLSLAYNGLMTIMATRNIKQIY